MQRLILRWAINAVALYVAVRFVPGIEGEALLARAFGSQALAFLGLGIIFALVNALIRPLLNLLSCPLIVLTLGLFTLVINGVVFWLTGAIGQSLEIGFTAGPWPAFLGGLVVGVVNAALTLLLREEFKRR